MKQKIKMMGALLLSMSIFFTGCAGRQKEHTGGNDIKEQKKVQKEITTEGKPKELTEEKEPVFISEGIRRIQVVTGGETLYEVEYVPREQENSYEYWKMAVPYENRAIVDTEAMMELYNSAESLDFTPVTINEGADTGLESPVSEIALDFCQTTQEAKTDAQVKREASDSQPDSGEEVMYEAYADSTCTLLIGKSDGEGNYYTALKSVPQRVYKMSSSAIDAILNTQPFSLILKVGTVVAINTVEEINIKMDQEKYQMSLRDGIYKFNDIQVEESDYHSLYSELLSVLLDREITQEPFEEEVPLLEIEFVRNSEKVENVTIQYLTYDEENAVLRQNGVEKFLVKTDDVNQLKDTIRKNLK